jgi:hypothetical protein
MLFEAYAVEDSRAVWPPASMPSVILISRTGGGRTPQLATPRMVVFIPPASAGKETAGDERDQKRNDTQRTAAEAVYF